MKKRTFGLMVLLCLYGFLNGSGSSRASAPEPRFETRSKFQVMGVSLRDNNDPTEKMRLWLNLYRVQSGIPNAVAGAEFGVTYYASDYNPSSQKGIIYLIGNEVQSAEYIPSGMTLRTIPEARYAVFEHRGTIDTLGDTYKYIFSDWLPKHKVRALGQDIFEKYDSRFSFDSEDSVMEIWVPVPSMK